MTATRRLPFLSCLLLIAIAPAPRAQGNLGLGKMWTFENPPLGYLKEEYGFEPTREWLDALRLASLRLDSGCSASFVSPKGLIMTNHHCVRGFVGQLSPADQDWVKDGFYARALADEVKIPNLTIRQLVAMKDVTDEMSQGIAESDDDAAVGQKQAANQQKLGERLGAEHAGHALEFVRLHQGAAFHVYVYKVFDDIRLVCTPHLQTAHFGGDPDNFTYPRYSIDFGFCRAYENDQPVDSSKHYFKWSMNGAKKGDLVFVTGNPGSTDRLKTKAQMDFMRDASYPMIRQHIDNRLSIMRELASESPAQERALRNTIFSYENGQKAYAGYHGGLLNKPLMAQKVRAEAEFKQRVLADPELKRKYGDAWDKLEEISSLKAALEARRRFHTTGHPTFGDFPQLLRAVLLARAVSEPAKQDEHGKRAMGLSMEMAPLQRAIFLDHLTRAGEWLAPNDPYRTAVLGNRTPEETLALLEKSPINDDAFVVKLLEAGEEAVLTSEDPVVQMGVVLAQLIPANAKMQAWLAEQENAQGIKIGRALFAVYGNNVSPDATFTLRFSDGRVDGFRFNGTVAPYRTSFYGLFARQAEFDGKYPFSIPQVWLDRKDQIDMTKAVNFVSTNDIIGGNSGSPIVNKELEVVGLIFDGNIEMLANRFLYTDDVPRAVSVHVQAIMEALRKIYDAGRVAEELTGM